MQLNFLSKPTVKRILKIFCKNSVMKTKTTTKNNSRKNFNKIFSTDSCTFYIAFCL